MECSGAFGPVVSLSEWDCILPAMRSYVFISLNWSPSTTTDVVAIRHLWGLPFPCLGSPSVCEGQRAAGLTE